MPTIENAREAAALANALRMGIPGRRRGCARTVPTGRADVDIRGGRAGVPRRRFPRCVAYVLLRGATRATIRVVALTTHKRVHRALQESRICRRSVPGRGVSCGRARLHFD